MISKRYERRESVIDPFTSDWSVVLPISALVSLDPVYSGDPEEHLSARRVGSQPESVADVWTAPCGLDSLHAYALTQPGIFIVGHNIDSVKFSSNMI